MGAKFQDRWSWTRDVQQDWVDQITDDYPRLMEAIESARYAHSHGMGAFMCFMAVRLLEMRRVLKSTGSMYLHCDPTASHYIKAVMDAIFGQDNFQNEIVWKRYDRPKGSQHRSKRYGRSSDTILFYSKKNNHTFYADEIRIPLSGEEIKKRFSSVDEKGRFMSGPLLRSPSMGDRPNLVFEFQDYTPGTFGWRMAREKLQEIYDRGDFYFTSKGVPRRKFRPGEEPGAAIDNVWIDINALQSHDQERLGYPTQKPIELYTRIVRASSKKTGIVLDPFAGCATTLIAAEQAGRQWVGIDIWDGAHDMVIDRLKTEGLLGDSLGKAGHLVFGDIHYAKEPSERTDSGETAAPFLRVTEKRKRPPLEPWQKLSRAQIVRELTDAQSVTDGLVLCSGCGRELEAPFMELDHIQPRADRGENDISNRILLCRPCNGRKSAKLTMTGLIKENKKVGWMNDQRRADHARDLAQERYEEIRYRRQWPATTTDLFD